MAELRSLVRIRTPGLRFTATCLRSVRFPAPRLGFEAAEQYGCRTVQSMDLTCGARPVGRAHGTPYRVEFEFSARELFDVVSRKDRMHPPARLLAILALAFVVVAANAQQPPPSTPPPQSQQPRPATPAPQRRATPKPTLVQVIVRDVSGFSLSGVKVTVVGPANQEVTTDAMGVASLGALADGTYRLRFDHDGFITFEREVNIKAGQPSEIYAALRIAPAAPPPPSPAPAPAPAAPPPPAPTASVPSGPPVFVSIPEFLDKNYIGGREALKESVLGCLSDSTTRLLQLHENIAEHTHGELDEVLYVVAGEGAVRIKGELSPVNAGSVSIIPRGNAHAIERKGKNPLMVLSTLSGAPCRAPEVSESASRKK